MRKPFGAIARLFGSPNQRQTHSAVGVFFMALGLLAFVVLQKPAALWYFGIADVHRASSCSALLYDTETIVAVNTALIAVLGGLAMMLTALVDRRISSERQRVRIWYYGRVLLVGIFFIEAAWSTGAALVSKSLSIETSVWIAFAFAFAISLIGPLRKRLQRLLHYGRPADDKDLRAPRGS